VRGLIDIADFRSWAVPPPDMAVRSSANKGVDLRPTGTREFGAYNFGRPRVASIYGGSSSSRHPSQDIETSSHLDSQDFSGVNLDLTVHTPFVDPDVSMEIGRERVASRDRSRSAFEFGRRAGSAGLGSLKSGQDNQMDFEPVDLGLDFDVTIDQEVPNLEERDRRESECVCDLADM
jgi:cohesin complex subunit SCC1